MKQQDWIDFFQAVNGRNPSIQEMAEAAQKGEFVRETPKQTVEVTETVSQKETVETTNGSEVVEDVYKRQFLSDTKVAADFHKTS